MNIQSTFEKDIRVQKSSSGAYEWWYFDAISNDRETKLVVIFYEGNPFSRRYIKQQKDNKACASDFPAISISVYQNQQPIYYSFTEVRKEQAHFSNCAPSVQIGRHQLIAEKEKDTVIYKLKLNEQLLSGNSIEARLEFKSIQPSHNIFNYRDTAYSNHCWNINQPRARVSGKIRYKGEEKNPTAIEFEGTGYHDHNIGSEPLKEQFDHWYWGRFHFKNRTLIYYFVNESHQAVYGWLINHKNQQMVQVFDAIRLQDHSRSLFGLHSARKIILSNKEAEVMIQQTHLLDNGPFYQRFSSNAFLNIPAHKHIESISGITEYICPPRIYNKLYWPLINMRIRYKHESPHWVQRFKTLYRWTW